MSTRAPIRVLVVDDSALVRKVLTESLGRYHDIEVVGSARDPFEARERILELAPDVITLDIEMPRMDGLTFLEKLMRTHPMRVIVVSSVAPASSANAVRAMSLGAVDVVPKPEGSMSVPDVERYLVRAVRTAATIPTSRLQAPRRRVIPPAPGRRSFSSGTAATRLVAIGASTGGPPALETVLGAMSSDSPGTVIVQHLPPQFTRAFAQRLDGLTTMQVREAEDGELILNGTAYVAAGGRHLVVRKTADGFRMHLKSAPAVHHQCPAVDVLFDSVAAAAGPSTVAVLLTGMGADGARGMVALREAGAWTIAQNEATSVVYGMPREAVEAGGACEVLALDDIAAGIARKLAPRYAVAQ